MAMGRSRRIADSDVIAQVQALQLYIAVVLLSTLPVAAILEQRES